MLVIGLIGFVLLGISLGMLGGGGSILAVPILVHVLGLSASEAVRISLPVVGLASLLGAWKRWRMGQLRLDTVVIFAAGTMLAAFVAARLGADIPDRPRLLLFTAVLLVAAGLMLRRALQADDRKAPAAEQTGSGLGGTTRLFVTALGIGALTGLLGVGGGFLMVPALVAVIGLAMPEATATSLAVIALNTAAASAGWWGQAAIDVGLLVMATLAAFVGILIGTKLAPKVSSGNLAKAFAVLLVLVGVFMLIKEL